MKKKTYFDEEQQVSNIEVGWKQIVLRVEKSDEEFYRSLKAVSGEILAVIEESQEIKVNFSVVEGFQHLSQLGIKEDRATVKIVDI